MSYLINSKTYFETLQSLKTAIKQAQLRAHVSVNRELVLLYWQIGSEILRRQQELGWGAKVIDQLSQDLAHEFPGMTGLGARNLKYMRKFVEEYSDYEFVQQVVARLPWGHNVVLMDKVSDKEIRQFYIQNAIEHGWSRNVMVMQIDTKLHERQGKALTNFKVTLPSITSDLAQQIFKDEYNLEFLDVEIGLHERQLEKSLVDNIKDFLLELGTGFAFMGSQYKLTVGGDDFYIDLLFYHTKLHCYIVIELKTGKFQPSYMGQLEFYLTAIDMDIKHESDNPTIGLLLCQQANKLVVDYSLKDKRQPIGVSKYKLSENKLPKGLEDALPSPEQFEHFFETIKKEND